MTKERAFINVLTYLRSAISVGSKAICSFRCAVRHPTNSDMSVSPVDVLVVLQDFVDFVAEAEYCHFKYK
ncbi:MAG: hypothetical protein F6J93_24085 [Oscillatoria sp. SIO1A7]|nr:hypothetical protein [Oscillatoria sp. SIO1A7]